MESKIYVKETCSISSAGSGENHVPKQNQDSFLEMKNINKNPNFHIFAVCDGHGLQGHLISQFIVKRYKSYIEENENLKKLDTTDKIYNFVKQNNYEFIKKSIEAMDNGVKKRYKEESIYSGSTMVMVYIIGEHIICSNIGDSRAILVKNHKDVIALSEDQKPNNESEKKRIEEKGGEVRQLEDEDGPIGPFRVFSKGQQYPGIAMSRSIGDILASDIGVICLPEIKEEKIDDTCKYIALASDGVWEFINNEKAAHYLNKYPKSLGIKEAIEGLIKKAKEYWDKEDVVCDDITVIAVYFKK
jgi:serine/threonine protein phosphatase PrpC